MIVRVAVALLAAFALLLGGGAMLPARIEVARSIVIERPPASVHGLVNGFATFTAWSPWMDRDPEMQFVISDPAYGVGARFEWRGDPRQVGAGVQEVVSSMPPRSVEVRVDSEQLGRETIRYEIERIAGGSRLTWRHETDVQQGAGPLRGLLARYFGLFYGRWVARDIEQGLVRIQRLARSLPAADFAGLRVEPVTVSGAEIVYLTAFEGAAGQAIEPDLETAWRDLLAAMAAQRLERAGQPLAITRSVDGGWQVDAAFPVATPAVAAPPLRLGRAPSGAALRVVHRGPYHEIAPVYAKLAAWMAVRDLREARVSWEVYRSDPAVTPPDERETHVYVMLAD